METIVNHDPRVRAAIEHYLLDLDQTQPKNTTRTYKPKQREWKVRTAGPRAPRPPEWDRTLSL